VAVRHLHLEDLRRLPVPICSVEEQELLSGILDQAFSSVAAINTEITTALAKIAALRQAILKQAFSGRLVPQDPNDEPAGALLARLRDTVPPTRTRRKTLA
jgi:type I restriction enzyme S subunit